MGKKGKKIGFIGCGNIFRLHLDGLRQNEDLFELVAICDSDKDRVKKLSDELGTLSFVDYKEMLRKMNGRMDFISITSPNSFHFDQAVDALRSGYDILVEKPVDLLHSRVQEIDQVAKSLKRQAYTVLQVRYNKMIGLLRETLKRKYLGKVLSVNLTQRWFRPEQYFESWRGSIESGGWTLYEIGIHYLDVLQWLFGMPEIKATCSFSHKGVRLNFKDTFYSIMTFPSGASGIIEVTTAASPVNLENSIAVVGSKGYIKINRTGLAGISGKDNLASDKIEAAVFESNVTRKAFEKLVYQKEEEEKKEKLLGSSPHYALLYKDIARGVATKVKDAIHSIKFIESIYLHEL